MRGASRACQGQQVVVVDGGGAESMESMRGQGGGVVVLEGERLQRGEVSEAHAGLILGLLAKARFPLVLTVLSF